MFKVAATVLCTSSRSISFPSSRKFLHARFESILSLHKGNSFLLLALYISFLNLESNLIIEKAWVWFEWLRMSVFQVSCQAFNPLCYHLFYIVY